jgi:hypothetical protein
MPEKKKSQKEEIDEQLNELIENTRQQTSTLKKLIAEMEKRNTFMGTRKSNKKEE